MASFRYFPSPMRAPEAQASHGAQPPPRVDSGPKERSGKWGVALGELADPEAPIGAVRYVVRAHLGACEPFAAG